jgi:nucleoside recognition membrane protein YjiH
VKRGEVAAAGLMLGLILLVLGATAMPIIPWLGIGSSPVLQWFVVPGIAFSIAFEWRTILNSRHRRR